MSVSKSLGLITVSAMCGSAMLLPVALPQQASARTVKASGDYLIISPLASSGSFNKVRSVKLTKKKLTVKGTVLKGLKKMKGSSFTFRVSPKVWIGEYEEDNPPYKKYTGSKRSSAIKRWNKCRFISITIRVKGGKVVKLVSHA